MCSKRDENRSKRTTVALKGGNRTSGLKHAVTYISLHNLTRSGATWHATAVHSSGVTAQHDLIAAVSTPWSQS